MPLTISIRGFAISMLAVSLMAIGCGQADKTAGGSAKTPKANDHSLWWCVEHGIPEEDCSMCSAKAAAQFKAEGDWCKQHDRAESQCFICNPERAKTFAALYEAKYGKKPPKPTE